MRILLDQGTPAPLRAALARHQVETAFERGWHMLQNGALLSEAEAAGFEVMVTTDKNIRHQENLKGRMQAILVANHRLATDQPAQRLGGGRTTGPRRLCGACLPGMRERKGRP